MKTYSITDVGKRREMNQDYVFASDQPVGNLPNLLIVADGMGGHKAGDLASRYAVETMVEYIRDAKKEERPIPLLGAAIHTANDAVAAKAALTVAIQTIDKAASKGILHKNNAAHKKSRLTKMVNAM